MNDETDTLLAMQAGATVILASLMATHPDYRRFQLHLSGLLEVADAGMFFRHLSERERQIARDYVEHLQRIHEAPTEIDPTATLRTQSG